MKSAQTHMDCAEALHAKGGKTSTKYVAPTPNVGASGGSSAQLGQRCTWINEFKTFVFHSHKLLSYSTDISSISFFPAGVWVSFVKYFQRPRRHLMQWAMPVHVSSSGV